MTTKSKQRNDPVPLLEWITAALGALVAIAFFVTIALSLGDETREALPMLSVRVERAVAGDNHHSLRLVVANASDRTAKQVQVEGKLGGEVSSMTLDYVPARSTAEGAILFKSDPRGGAVELRITGYQLP